MIFATTRFILYSYFITIISSEQLTNALADINSNGLPTSILLNAAGLEDDNNRPRLVEQLNNPEVRKTLVSKATEYMTGKVDNNLKQETKETSRAYSDYCSYSWVRWLSFMDCESSTSENDKQVESAVKTSAQCSS